MGEKRSYFRTLQDGEATFDGDTFLTEVGSQFQSENIVKEVRWRIAVLKEISSQPELTDISEGLRNRLTQIFSAGSAENEILDSLKTLTEVKRSDGQPVELRRFLKRSKRTLNEFEYRRILTRKIENTEFQMINLMALFPEARQVLSELTNEVHSLISNISDQSQSIIAIKAQEDGIRGSTAFEAYEELKSRFLKDWLGQFADLSTEDLEGMDAAQVQQLVVEHQRHQMTQLLKTKIIASDVNMTEHLGLHDTLECGFSDKDFWNSANDRAQEGFRQWILAIIRTFGMLKGKRYSFFQSEEDKDQYLLFGVGIADLEEEDGEGVLEMVPYVKPFTRKGGYLLEVRKREIGDPEQYYYELRHYVLPFLFAFDQIQNFNVSKELITFFTSSY